MYAILDLDVVELDEDVADTVKKHYIDNGYSIEESISKEVSDKLADHKTTFTLNLMRFERDSLLSQTDWWGSSDQIMTDEQKDYRQLLRDVPATASPELNSDWKLTNIIWPTKPE